MRKGNVTPVIGAGLPGKKGEWTAALALDTIDNQVLLADVYLAMSEELSSKAYDGYVKAKKMSENLMGENCSKVQSIRKKMQKIGC